MDNRDTNAQICVFEGQTLIKYILFIFFILMGPFIVPLKTPDGYF